MLWYFSIPTVPVSLHALLLFILLDGDCCLFFNSPAMVLQWMGVRDTLQMCIPVCVCVWECEHASTVSTDLFLDLQTGLSDEECS